MRILALSHSSSSYLIVDGMANPLIRFDSKRTRAEYLYWCRQCKNVIKSYSDIEGFALRSHGRHCKGVDLVTDADFDNADVVEGEGYDVTSLGEEFDFNDDEWEEVLNEDASVEEGRNSETGSEDSLNLEWSKARDGGGYWYDEHDYDEDEDENGDGNDDDGHFYDPVLLLDEVVHSLVSLEVYRIQLIMMNDLSKKSAPPVILRKQKDYNLAHRIGHFSLNVGLSQRQGDELLKLMKLSSESHVLSLKGLNAGAAVLPPAVLYQSMKRLNEVIGNNPHGFFKCEKKNYFLPAIYIGDHAALMRPYVMERANVLEKISLLLLNLDHVEDLKTVAMPLTNSYGEKVYGPFSSGYLFRQLTSEVRRVHGENAVPLCITLSWDGATVIKTGNITATPCVMGIANLESKKETPLELLGYVPEALPYSHEELVDLLIAKNIMVIEDQEFIISRMLNDLRNDFITWLVEPLMALSNEGFHGIVGMDLPGQGVSTKYIFVPIMTIIDLDSSEAVGVCGTSYSGAMPCRCCDASKRDVHNNVSMSSFRNIVYRDSKRDEELSAAASNLMDKSIARKQQRHLAHLPPGQRTKSQLELLSKVKERGLGEKNYCIRGYYEWFRRSEDVDEVQSSYSQRIIFF